MSELYLMLTVTDRSRLPEFVDFFRSRNLDVNFITLAYGTAGRGLLRNLGLDNNVRAMFMSVVTGETWNKVRSGLIHQIHIDVPGTGIAMTVPLSSIGGRRELAFLTDGQHFEKGEESTLKNTEYELITVICNQGYSETVMDAAREAGAGGGTVIHSHGTGMQKAEKFLGISLSSEKDVVLICSLTAEKRMIMETIMKKAGPETDAGAISLSLPVTHTAGLHFRDEDETEDNA